MAIGTRSTSGSATKRLPPCSVGKARQIREPERLEPCEQDGDSLDALIRKLYDAVLQEESWPSFLEGLARAVRADAVALVAATTDGTVLREVTFDLGTDPSARRDYLDYYADLDPWARAGALDEPVGAVAVSERFVSESSLARTEFYNDYYRPNGWHHGFGAKLFEDAEGMAAVVTGHRHKRRGAFSPEDERLLARLVPHLRRALRMRHELEAVSAEREAGAQLLDRVSVGTILVDERGRVVRTNRIADDILARCDGLASRPDGLEAAVPQQTVALRRAIAEAAATSRGEGLGAGGRFRISRPSGRSPYLLEVSPIERGAEIWGSGRSLAAILLTDGNGGIQPDERALQTFYELTPAEAELTALLARGLSLDEAADHRGVSRNTARGQLKRIFAKTGTKRQAELVRMVLQGPAGFAKR